ncbi:MAG: glucose 1-dehydrogenase [Chloroflexi bacterium]|nr:MAG: glucose 1-dehydrogenase [Chloroflexota bacterium]
MRNLLEDKNVLITGAASGIGRATATAFAQAGARVVVSDVDAQAGQAVAESLWRAGNGAIFVKADVTQSRDVEALIQHVIDHYGCLDYAVNNAGIFIHEGAAADVAESDWDATMDVNLKGVWLCMKHEIRHMREHGGGAIVNLSSVLGLRGAANAPAYAASKHGVIGLTKSAAIAYAKDNIRVNAVCPGIIETPMEQQTMQDDEQFAWLMSLYPMGRVGKPDEVAQTILWLCSDVASYITGAIVPIDGGHSAI